MALRSKGMVVLPRSPPRDRADACGQAAVMGSCSSALMLSLSRDQQVGSGLRVKHKLPNGPTPHQEGSYFSVCRDADR